MFARTSYQVVGRLDPRHLWKSSCLSSTSARRWTSVVEECPAEYMQDQYLARVHLAQCFSAAMSARHPIGAQQHAGEIPRSDPCKLQPLMRTAALRAPRVLAWQEYNAGHLGFGRRMRGGVQLFGCTPNLPWRSLRMSATSADPSCMRSPSRPSMAFCNPGLRRFSSATHLAIAGCMVIPSYSRWFHRSSRICSRSRCGSLGRRIRSSWGRRWLRRRRGVSAGARVRLRPT